MTDPLANIRAFLPLSERLATSGQPDAPQLAAIGAAGYEVVVNLLPPQEALPNEADMIASCGMEYVQIPVEWNAPTLDDLERFFAVLQARADKKVFVHCAANKRVSAFLYLYRVLHQGMAEEEAAKDMRRIWSPNETWQQFITAVMQRQPRAAL